MSFEIYRERRIQFQRQMEPDSAAIFSSALSKIKSNDVAYPFRQDSDFFYLTGFDEEDSILVLYSDRSILYLQALNPELEIWHGSRLGIERAAETLLIDEARDTTQFIQNISDLIKNKNTLYYFFGRSAEKDRSILGAADGYMRKSRANEWGPASIRHPSPLLHEMRMFKSPEEIEQIRVCSEITKAAHIAAMRKVQPGMFEYELEACLLYEFRRHGAVDAYPSIVAAGSNACTLHYIGNSSRIQKNDLIMIDAGAEKKYYNADVSRTFPAGKKFNSAQKDLYSIVLNVQKKAVAATVAGSNLNDIHMEAVLGLTEGMIDLGILSGSAEENIDNNNYKKYYMHRTGHWLGMDVHDAGSYRDGTQPRKLAPGMVMTVEPGLYLPLGDDSVPEAFRGIGIRIEDDVLVGPEGPENLTASIPKEISDIEALRN